MKQCNKCKVEKKLEDFSVNKTKPSGRNYTCKECMSIKAAQYRRDNPELHRLKDRKARWKSNYGITPEDYDQMLESQGNSCLTCQVHITQYFKDYFDVDHNHTTGRVRGLLCHNCNTSLGKLKENKETLRKMIFLIEEDEAWQSQ